MDLKASTDPASLICLGRLFYKNGARDKCSLTGEYGRRSSDKYKGANPFSDLNVNKIILKLALAVIGSQ